jgi:hypothetical protein
MPTNPTITANSTEKTPEEIHAFYQETIARAEAHFRNSNKQQQQELASLKTQLAERQDTIERMEVMHQNKMQEAHRLLDNLKNSSIKDLNRFRNLVVEKNICTQERVKSEGLEALEAFIDKAIASSSASVGSSTSLNEAKEASVKLANLQRRINDLESKNQNLTMLVEYAKEGASNPEFKKCREYIKELEAKLSRVNEEEYNTLKDECIILKAENAAFRQENAALQEKCASEATASASRENQAQKTSAVPSHPLFLQNFLANLDSLLAENEEKRTSLEAKYIQTADKTTKPIFQRIIDLKASVKQREPKENTANQFTNVPLGNNTPQDPIVADQKRKLRRAHANYTYEHESEDMETLEYIVFEQEDYIRKLESSLDLLLLQREPQRV